MNALTLRGMVHRVELLDTDVPETQLLIVSTLGSSTSATMTPGDRFLLAKALWPQAFEEAQPMTVEYAAEGSSHQFETRMLAELTAQPGAAIQSRMVTPWITIGRVEL